MSMSGPRAWAAQWSSKLGAIILVCFCLYYGFVAINTLGLPRQTGEATVLAKGHLPPGTSYQTLVVGGRKVVQPVGTAEAWVLTVRVDDAETTAMVDKALYDTLDPHDTVQAAYTRARITGTLRVVQVNATTAKGGR